MPMDRNPHSHPVISVIVATHRRPEKLRRAIRSVTQQTLEDIEIVLCADEGSAATRQVAADALRPHDIFLSLPGMRGPAASRNRGMQLARGRWLCFLDDDDSMEADYLTSVLPHLNASPDCVLFTDYNMLQEGDDEATQQRTGARNVQSLAEQAIPFLNVKNFIPVCGLFIPRILRDVVAFDPQLRSHEDWDFLLQLLRCAPFKHAAVNGVNYHRASAGSRNRLTRQERLADYLTIYRRNPVSEESLRKRRAATIARMGGNIAARHL
jgi:glycosyltransferase involved in cell wall biosynthesis